MPGFEAMWPLFDGAAENAVAEWSRLHPELGEQNSTAVKAQIAAEIAIREFKEFAETRAACVHEIAVAQHVIPNSEALDRMLRYEIWIDRSLNRALERLERMQRTRQDKNSIHLLNRRLEYMHLWNHDYKSKSSKWIVAGLILDF